ncbi:hypothetical protein HRI_001653000 [Hibiscus trionum]|uniref:Reverse transcriptase domain-containing protein n=1 Tax=Hibiscus trionum TaxID=183268 RepID=A0A9W7HLZ8_HIBTR|nr:hypothetical protein HRI_001653000 [Hibiscus trionum]
MRILCWNCQGLGQAPTVQHFWSYVQRTKPDIIFLCETKINNAECNRLCLSLGMLDIISISPMEGCSGISLFATNNFNISLISYSSRYIHIQITKNNSTMFFTGMHGFPETSQKYKTWEIIDSLYPSTKNNPWLLSGDFNEILTDSEKQGGPRRARSQIKNFRNCLTRNNLFDCKPTSGWFTWTKVRPLTPVIHERLDRFIANSAWQDLYPSHRIITEYVAKSDHCFLLLELDTSASTPKTQPSKNFRFESCWANNIDNIQTIKRAWADTPGTAINKIEAVGTYLEEWQNQQRFKSTGRIKFLTKKINKLLYRPLTATNEQVYLNYRTELNKLLTEQEIYWAQRSRTLWLSQGDKNTKFFHARASNRNKKNLITGLYDANSNWCTSEPDLMNIASAYFQNLFTTSNPQISNIILDKIHPSINSSMNENLLKAFTKEEILHAFKDIDPRKAPGFDGLPSSFFRQHWDTVGDDVINLCINLLNGNTDMASVNKTILVLIPKVQDPTSMKQLRPISLCTVLYKIVAKTIVNRMKQAIPLCISPNQAAFVQGRNISDNILVAHEIIHNINSGATKSSQGAALKLDMEKAFDRVEWSFLANVMECMGFASEWIELIMRCITTVSFSVKINNPFSPPFQPQRGLRQGDPLSLSSFSSVLKASRLT